MFIDDYESLFRMAEEYNRLIKPYTEQMEILNRWNEIGSSVCRVAEMNQDVLSALDRVDLPLANKLAEMTRPYQASLDNIAAMENMLATRFADLVRPEIYIPAMSVMRAVENMESSMTETTQVIANLQAMENAGLAQISKISHSVDCALSSAMQVVRPWQTSLSVISAFETERLSNTNLGRLVEMERAISRMPLVIERFEQITSVSAQIASLLNIGLTDSWKMAVTPPSLLQELNDFTLKQYELIRRTSDEATVKWRLGLIDTASKFVDDQAAFGTELAAECEESAPNTEASTPDFSELQNMLAYAKRDDLVVVEAYVESRMSIVTGYGKIIVQKAKVANDFCKARSQPLLFPENCLLNWAMVLSGTFCRDQYTLCVVLRTLQKMFVRREITDLIGKRPCFDDIEEFQTIIDAKKSAITTIQEQVYSQIIEIEDELLQVIQESVTVEPQVNEDSVSSDVLKALLNVQANRLYAGKNENAINDGVRDALRMVYEVRDQTRQGDSESGKDAGEIDIMLCNKGTPFAILEGLKLSYLNKKYLDTHIDKAMTNYDPIGCSQIYILAYATVADFAGFWKNVMEYMRDYSFSYETVEEIREMNTAFTESRHAKAVLRRSGKEFSFHLYAISMK